MAASSKVNEGGIWDAPKIFAELLCPCDKEVTRHSQLRVIAHWKEHWKAEWHILVRCSKCKTEYVWYTNVIPDGMSAYHVRIIAHGRTIPELKVTVPSLSEEFTVLAVSRQAAYRQSQFTSTMPLKGQLTETLVDGIEERDERF